MRKFYRLSLYLYNHRVVRYLFSGGTATLTNIFFLFIFVHVFGVHYLLSAVVAFIMAVCVSFMMQKFFTFNDYTKDKVKQQSTLYLGFQVFNLGLNTLCMYIAVDLLRIQYILAQISIAVMMAVYNFFVYKHLVFTPDPIYNKQE